MNGFHTGAWIDCDASIGAVDGAILHADIIYYGGSIDDGRVIDNHVVTANRSMKTVHIDEHEQWRGDDHASRAARRPADVIRAGAPDHPGRRPFNSRDPHPADARVVDPASVMITSPGPRFIADPVPADIRPFPMSMAVRSPIRSDAGRAPASSVRADFNPGPHRGQRLVKIRSRANLQAHGNVHVRSRVPCVEAVD